MASLMALMPGETVAVYYSDDSVWHERLLIWRFAEGVWYILTPDRDLYAEDLRCIGGDGPSRIKVKGKDFTYWSRVGGPSYRFAAPIGDDEFRKNIKLAYFEAMGESGFDSAWRPTEVQRMDGQIESARVYLGGLLTSQPRRLLGKQPVPTEANPGLPRDAHHQAAAAASGPDVDLAPTGSSWRAAEPRGDLKVGDVLTPTPGVDRSLGLQDAVFFRNGFWIRAELVTETLVNQWLADRVKSLAGVAPLNGGVEELLGIQADAKDAHEDGEGAPRRGPPTRPPTTVTSGPSGWSMTNRENDTVIGDG